MNEIKVYEPIGKEEHNLNIEINNQTSFSMYGCWKIERIGEDHYKGYMVKIGKWNSVFEKNIFLPNAYIHIRDNETDEILINYFDGKKYNTILTHNIEAPCPETASVQPI